MLSSASFWILAKYYQLEKDLDANLQSYELAHSVGAIYKFLWDDYANWYVEFLKTSEPDMAFAKELFKQFTVTCSPYCPFETEVLWKEYFGETELLASVVKDFDWTKKALELYFDYPDIENLEKDLRYIEFESIISFISSIRSLKGLFAIDPVVQVQIYSTSELLLKYQNYIKLLARAEINNESKSTLYEVNNNSFTYQIDILSYIKDKEFEINRTNKLIESLNKQIAGLESQLVNEKFVDNAEAEVIEEKRTDLSLRKLELQEQVSKLDFLRKEKLIT
jgi:valyl-tRNA synthetase